MAYGTYQTRNPKAVHSPVRSVPTVRPAAAVFGPTLLQRAQHALFITRRDLPRAEAFFADTRALLGDANRSKPSLRRGRQSKAMRLLNQARAQLRRARKAMVAAETAMLAFAGDLNQGAA